MFTKQANKAIHVLFVAGVTGAVLTSAPAHATEPVERTPSTMNQASVYESTLKFYLHPARLELGIEAPHEMGDHAAVIVAKSGRTPSDSTAKITRHPATVAKANQLPAIHTTQIVDLSVGERCGTEHPALPARGVFVPHAALGKSLVRGLYWKGVKFGYRNASGARRKGARAWDHASSSRHWNSGCRNAPRS